MAVNFKNQFYITLLRYFYVLRQLRNIHINTVDLISIKYNGTRTLSRIIYYFREVDSFA